jgi:hypothetical protein
MAIDVPIPPWLHGPQTDPANAYIQAFHVGSQLALEQSRLQQAQINAERDAQLQQQALQANLERAQQEIANRHAYQQSSLGMRQQAIDQAMQRTQMIAAREASKFASQQRFSEGLRSGKYKNVEEALFDNPDLMTPGTTGQLLRGKVQNVIHGPGGEVLRVQPDGTVKVLRAGEGKQPTVTVPLDPNNPFGPKISGPLNDPEIAKRYAAINATVNAPPQPSQGFSLMHPSTWFGGTPAAATPAAGVSGAQGSTAVSGSPDAAPVAQPAPTQYPEGAILKHKDGSRWTVQGGKLIPLTEEAAAVPAAAVAPEGTATSTAAPDEETTDEEVD